MVYLLVLGSKEEGDVTVCCKLAQLLQLLILVLIQFSAVTPTELLKTVGIVAPPFPELRAGRHVLEPMVIIQAFFGHAAGPELIDEHRFPTQLLVTVNNVMNLSRVNHGSQARRSLARR